MTFVDLILIAIYLKAAYYVGYKIRNKYYPEGHELRKYFIPGLTVKICGAIFICFIYLFYFGYGDIIVYHRTAKNINASLLESFGTWVRLVIRFPDLSNPI